MFTQLWKNISPIYSTIIDQFISVFDLEERERIFSLKSDRILERKRRSLCEKVWCNHHTM